jgi:hypothetical protein
MEERKENEMYRYMYGRLSAVIVLSLLLLAFGSTTTQAAPRTFGQLYHDGEVLRTFGVPSTLPHGGRDPLFVFTNGVSEQLSVTSVAPGDQGYHGGAWAVYEVAFTGDPYLLTSDEAIAAAAAGGDVTVTRSASQDFRCPVLP